MPPTPLLLFDTDALEAFEVAELQVEDVAEVEVVELAAVSNVLLTVGLFMNTRDWEVPLVAEIEAEFETAATLGGAAVAPTTHLLERLLRGVSSDLR